MKNKKLLGLLIGIVCIAVCFVLVLTMCSQDGQEPAPTEPASTQPEVTEPKNTEPEITEAPTEEATEVPTQEQTEPTTEAPTEPNAPNVNTGTGGGYVPGTQDPTEPEETTEPVIEVPEPGAENNAYVEQFSDPTGQFSTVVIPAGESIHYNLLTPGYFLQVTDDDVSVTYEGKTYTPEDGVLELSLPADEQTPVALRFVNQGREAKPFAVSLLDALGTKTNPIPLDGIEAFVCSSDKAEGTYYSWIANKTGMLQIYSTQNIMSVAESDLIVQVAEQTAKLSEHGRISLPVTEGDQVILQAQPAVDEDGNVTVMEGQYAGYVAEVIELTVEQLPCAVDTVSIPAGQSVYYYLSGLSGNTLTVDSENIGVIYQDSPYIPEEGVLSVLLSSSGSIHQVELFNLGVESAVFTMEFGYPLGHSLNPQIVTELGELPTAVSADLGGYYYSYQAPSAGEVSFQVWEYPTTEDAVTDVILRNETTGVSASLWTEDADGQMVDNYVVSLPVGAGDLVTIHVTVEDANGNALTESLMIMGELYGAADKPISVQHPGFTAHVPAGSTLYYEGYNLNELIFSLTGEAVSVIHNGISHTASGGQLQFEIVAEGRVPATFAVTNTGTKDAVYEVSFLYPEGHMEKPAQLQLGTNSVTRKEGASDYYYTFTAPRAGVVEVTFDSAASWVYAVDNLTQYSYGETQYSDSEPLMATSSIAVAAGDTVQIRVNTYDPAAPWAAPAGDVRFQAVYKSGPTAITNFSVPTNTTLMAGEYGLFHGNLYGYILTVNTSKNVQVIFNGQTYVPENGQIRVEFPQSGDGLVEYLIYNNEASQSIYSMSFTTNDVGSPEHPEKLTFGTHTMVQSINGGSDYYYEYTATARGTLVLTFDPSVEAIYIINDQQAFLPHAGQATQRIMVKPGTVVRLAVNTYDRRNPSVSPVGEVTFTVSFQ